VKKVTIGIISAAVILAIFVSIVAFPFGLSCFYLDGYNCEDVQLIGGWESENDYSIQVNEDLYYNSPIFENESFCSIYLKEGPLDYDEFVQTIKKISTNSTFEFTENSLDVNLKFKQCYPSGGLICPLDNLKRKPKCFFYGLEKEQDLSRALSMCSSNLPNEIRDSCYSRVIQKYAETDSEKALQLCDKHFYNTRDRCYTDIGKLLAVAEAEKSIEICKKIMDFSTTRKGCADFIKIYEKEINISEKELALRCLNYTEGDELTRFLCKYGAVKGWCAQHQLLWIYGMDYETKSLEYCQKLDLIESGSKEKCLKSRNGTFNEINRGNKSALYRFVNQYPDGLGINHEKTCVP